MVSIAICRKYPLAFTGLITAGRATVLETARPDPLPRAPRTPVSGAVATLLEYGTGDFIRAHFPQALAEIPDQGGVVHTQQGPAALPNSDERD